MTTLFDATLALAKILGNVRSSTTTAAGTTTTIVDSTRTEANDFWNGGTIWITSGALSGVSRKISDWALTGTTFTVPAMASAPGSGVSYSVIVGDWPQDKLIEFINSALRDIGDVPKTNATLTTVADQEQYTLPAGVRDVRRVEIATSKTTPYDYQPWIGVWRETEDGKLQFDTHHIPDEDGYLIRLTYVGAHSAVSADTDTIHSLIHLDRLIWSAAVHAWRWRMQMAKQDEPMHQMHYQEAVAMAERMRTKHPIIYAHRPVRLSL